MQTQQHRGGLNFSTVYKQPLLKCHSVPITIKRYFTTVDGALIAKGTAPAQLQVEYPFFMWGDFDRAGGYNNGFKIMPVIPGTEYLMTYVEGAGLTSQQITGFSGFNTIRSRIRIGDIVHVFTDSLQAPTHFVWVVLSSRNGSLASIVGNSETAQRDGSFGRLFMDHFQYYTDNQSGQWNVAVNFIRSTNIASFANNPVQPYIFKTPYTEQEGFIRMECNFNVDQFLTIGTYFLYDTEEINISFSLAQ